MFIQQGNFKWKVFDLMYTREDPYQVMSMQDFSSAIHITTNKPGLQAIK